MTNTYLTLFLHFTSTIGSITATLRPLPIILLQFGFGSAFFALLIISTMIQICIGNILKPKIMGDELGLHPHNHSLISHVLGTCLGDSRYVLGHSNDGHQKNHFFKN